MKPYLLPVLTLVLGSFCNAQTSSVSIFTAEPGHFGDVVVFEEDEGEPVSAPEALSNIRFLPIDFAGRTVLEQFLPGRPRLHVDADGTARLQLPEQGGSLYRYERTLSNGSSIFGFLLVDSTGWARSVFALPGAGSSMTQDPFVPFVAVAPFGDAMLVTTREEAGGDLFEIDLPAGTSSLRTSALTPQSFGGSGLSLRNNWGFAVSTTSVLRFHRSSVGDATVVPFADGATPTWFSGEVVASRNGAFAATIAGSSPTSAHVYTFGPRGPVSRVSETPGQLAGAGFLPDAPDGPTLAISNDGSQVAWIEVLPGTDELFMTSRPAATWETATHVTADELFNPFIDEIGQFVFIGGLLVFAAGDPAPGGGITRVDYFRASLDGPQPVSVINLSQSYGQVDPPFSVYSNLSPLSASIMPDLTALLIHDGNTEPGRLLAVLTAGHSGNTPRVLVDDIESLDVLETFGPSLLLSVKHGDTQDSSEVLTFTDVYAQPTTVLPLAEDDAPLVSSITESGRASLVTPVSDDGGYLWSLDLAASQASLLNPTPLDFSSTPVLTASGATAFSIEARDNHLLGLWKADGTVLRLIVLDERGFFLP